MQQQKKKKKCLLKGQVFSSVINMQEALGLMCIQHHIYHIYMVAHSCKTRIGEVDAGRSKVQGNIQL